MECLCIKSSMGKSVIASLYFLYSFFSLVSSVSHPKVQRTEWCYDTEEPCGPDFWGGVCNTGRSQSPIDLDFHQHTNIFFQRKTSFALSSEYFRQFDTFYAINNGHSLQVQLVSGVATSNVILRGGALPGSYTFSQLHFHWADRNSFGSEHTVNGRRYPMELHMVHYKSVYGSFADAMDSNDPEAIAVLGIFFEIGKHDNPAINPVIQAASSARLTDQGALMQFNMPFKLTSFFPWKLDFVRYQGSLTTPTCDEQVVWTVFRYPIYLSQAQMNAFRQLRDHEMNPYNNYRPIQPTNGRSMKYYTAKSLGSFFPSVDRIWNVKGGFGNFLTEMRYRVIDLVVSTLLTPSIILNYISRFIVRMFSFILPWPIFIVTK